MAASRLVRQHTVDTPYGAGVVRAVRLLRSPNGRYHIETVGNEGVCHHVDIYQRLTETGVLLYTFRTDAALQPAMRELATRNVEETDALLWRRALLALATMARETT